MPTCQRQTTLSLCRRVEYSGGGGDILYPSTHRAAAAVGGPRFLMTGQIQKDPALLQQQDQRVAVVVAVAWDT